VKKKYLRTYFYFSSRILISIAYFQVVYNFLKPSITGDGNAKEE
jgi:hypothetical protein